MIEKAKKKTKLKGYQLAEFLEVSEPTIYAWERGNKHGKTWPLWAIEKCELEVK